MNLSPGIHTKSLKSAASGQKRLQVSGVCVCLKIQPVNPRRLPAAATEGSDEYVILREQVEDPQVWRCSERTDGGEREREVAGGKKR